MAAMPKVGTKFTITHRHPWGDGRTEVEVIACTVTAVTAGQIEYRAESTVSLEDRCPAYSPTTGGGMTAAGWNLFLSRGIVRLTPEG